MGSWCACKHGQGADRSISAGRAGHPPSTSGGSTCLDMHVKPTMLRVGGQQGGEVMGGKVNLAPALHCAQHGPACNEGTQVMEC